MDRRIEDSQKLAPIFFTVTAIALAFAACTSSPAERTTTARNVAGVIDTGSLHLIPSRIRNVCTRQRWNPFCDIPEYTDEQRLIDSAGNYGPYAYTFPDSNLADRTNASFATVGAAVAIIYVDTTEAADLPRVYDRLGLVPMANCVYLRSSGQTYEGYVLKANADGLPCDTLSGPPQTPSIPVKPTGIGSNVPPVARFHEGSLQGPPGARQTLFGVKCGEQWCFLTPAGSDTLSDIHHGRHPDRPAWASRGWGDGQHLAVKPSQNAPLRPGNFEASVIPGSSTEFSDSTQYQIGVWYPAATAYFTSAPTGEKYRDKWEFRPGENPIYIRHNGPGDWEARIRKRDGGFLGVCNVFTCWHKLAVKRKRHPGVTIPASARFLWLEDDEGIWVRCADGCCKVSGS